MLPTVSLKCETKKIGGMRKIITISYFHCWCTLMIGFSFSLGFFYDKTMKWTISSIFFDMNYEQFDGLNLVPMMNVRYECGKRK